MSPFIIGTDILVLGGIPVDDPKNRAYAQRMGIGDVSWPVPYGHSIVDTCAHCDGAVYLGPELQRQKHDLTDKRVPFLILCLLDALLEGRAPGGMAMISLSDKKPGE